MDDRDLGKLEKKLEKVVWQLQSATALCRACLLLQQVNPQKFDKLAFSKALKDADIARRILVEYVLYPVEGEYFYFDSGEAIEVLLKFTYPIFD